MRLLPILFAFVLCTSCSERSKPNFLEEKLSSGFTDVQGENIGIERLEGKVIILNLWATWCKPCIEEMPALEGMQSLLPPDYQLILASDESMKKIKGFSEQQEFDLNFVQMGTSLESLGIYSLPTTLIIDSIGNLKGSIVGAQAWNNEDQIAKIKKMVQ